uniref:Rho-GAP domain-containing protein n=1 Tax=Macrostomum lignano TaxID=282301 RepID=A0A1I8IRD9_9PLAT
MRIVDYNACLLDGPDLRGALLDQERMLDDSVKSMKRVIDSFNRVRETGLSHSEALLAFGRAISELGAGSSDSTDAGKPSSSVGALKAEREMASFFVQLSQDLEYIEEARSLCHLSLLIAESNQDDLIISSLAARRWLQNSQRLFYFGRTYEYVKALQFRQAMNKSRFFEIIASLQSVWKCFYQECNDNLGDREQQMHHMNKSVMLFNSSVESAEKELDENKQQLLSSQLLPASLRTSSGQHEGYLLLAQKKLGIPTSWQRCYCTLTLESRHISLQPYSPANPAGSSAAAAPISGVVSSVTEDTSSGRKFTFEVATIEGRSLLLQAYSNSNFRAWVQALSGQRGSVSDEQADADRLIACLRALESRGLQEEGLYRVEGQNREVEELLQSFVLGGSPCNLETVGERVLSTCIKRYLKRLPQPLLTFDFVEYLINSSDPANDSQSHRPLAKLRDRLSTDKLPAVNRRLLAELLQHLRRVADQSAANRMPADNLAMVFAPTLCWPRQMNLQSVQLCAVEGKQLL